MAEETNSPISAAKPPVANPIAPAGGGTIKLKPVLRKTAPGVAPAINIPAKPVVRQTPPAAPAPAAAPKAIDQLKTVTQRLKEITQEIPQQAILRKTGIISDQAMTEAQKQAAKARTARIQLSDAIGATAASSSARPMKTIRIKRPVDIPPPGSPKPPVAGSAPAPAPVAHKEPAPLAPVSDEVADAPTIIAGIPQIAPGAAEGPGATVTQRKTLKVARPGGPRMPSKFGVKRPAAPAADHAPAAAQPADADIADIPEDIPDIPTMATVPGTIAVPAGEKDVPVAVGIVSLVVQAAACVAMGVLAWMLYQDTLIF